MSSDEPKQKPESDRHATFVELFARHQRAIYGFIYTLIPRHNDAEDLLSETSVVLWEKFDTFAAGSDFVAWACRIAQFKVLNYRKAEARSPLVFNDDLLSDLADLRLARGQQLADQVDALVYCLEKLPARDRRLVDLCYDGTRTIIEAAELLERPSGSVYNSLARVRGVLLECVQRRIAAEGNA